MTAAKDAYHIHSLGATWDHFPKTHRLCTFSVISRLGYAMLFSQDFQNALCDLLSLHLAELLNDCVTIRALCYALRPSDSYPGIHTLYSKRRRQQMAQQDA